MDCENITDGLSSVNNTKDVANFQREPCIALGAVAFVGILGNVVAYFTLILNKLKHLSFSVYIISLSLADIFTLLLTTVPHLIESFYGNHMWTVAGIPAYLSIHFFSQTSQMISSWLMVAISVDRFIVVVFPLSRCRMCTKKRATMTSLGILLACSVVMVIEIAVGLLKQEPFLNSCETTEFDTRTRLRGLGLTLIGPALVCIVLNVKVFVAVKEIHRTRRHLSESPVKQSVANQGQLRVTFALTVLSAVTALSYIPVAAFKIVDVIQAEDHFAHVSPSAFFQRRCISELIYIVGISLHFYILILILYRCKKSCMNIFRKAKSDFKSFIGSSDSCAVSTEGSQTNQLKYTTEAGIAAKDNSTVTGTQTSL